MGHPPGDPGPTVLLVSAAIGEGHNAASAALADALRRTAPGCTVRFAEPMGGRTEGLVQALYRIAVQYTPPLQNLWYRAVARCSGVRWFYREVVGARVGRALTADLAATRPDVVVSTYPLGTAGLAWLQRTGRTTVPVLAVLSDFAPHAFWTYPGVGRYYVLHDDGRRRMRTLAPEVPTEVCAPLVTPSFRPASKVEARAARHRHGLPPDALTVLISCGALGMGAVGPTVRAVLAAGPTIQVVVVCGRNHALRDRLRRRFGRCDRVRVFGWVEDMADLMAGVDVVVNNAGGATASEALARGRALVLFRPIAGHGIDSARLLAGAGLADVGRRRRWLTRLLRRWAARPELMRAAQRRAAAHAGRHDLDATARSILAHAGRTRPRRTVS